jgi:hypothetical protein
MHPGAKRALFLEAGLQRGELRVDLTLDPRGLLGALLGLAFVARGALFVGARGGLELVVGGSFAVLVGRLGLALRSGAEEALFELLSEAFGLFDALLRERLGRGLALLDGRLLGALGELVDTFFFQSSKMLMARNRDGPLSSSVTPRASFARKFPQGSSAILRRSRRLGRPRASAPPPLAASCPGSGTARRGGASST